MQLKIVSYNIHKGIGGVDRRYSLDRIVDVLGHYHADILLLQEVDDGVPRSRHDRQIDVLQERLGFAHATFQANVRLRKGAYGNAILTRFPIQDSIDVDLTVGPKKRRQALLARLHVPIEGHSRTMVAVSLHLGLAGFERKIQLRRLMANAVVKRTHADTPMIIGGDFNDVWGNLGPACLEPSGFQLASGRNKTFPAWMPVRSLDSIYHRGAIQLDHAFASHLDLAKQASDHLPLVAIFQFDLSKPS